MRVHFTYPPAGIKFLAVPMWEIKRVYCRGGIRLIKNEIVKDIRDSKLDFKEIVKREEIVESVSKFIIEALTTLLGRKEDNL